MALEGAGHVPLDPGLDGPYVGQHGLRPCPVAAVAAALALGIVFPVAGAIGDLALQSRIQHPLGQLLLQPAPPRQLQSLGPATDLELAANQGPDAFQCPSLVFPSVCGRPLRQLRFEQGEPFVRQLRQLRGPLRLQTLQAVFLASCDATARPNARSPARP